MKLIIAILICAGIYWWWTSDNTSTSTDTPAVDTVQVDTLSTKQQLKTDVKQLVNSTVDVTGDVINVVKDMVK